MALDWLEERLKVSLGFDQTKEIADYLYKIEDNDELVRENLFLFFRVKFYLHSYHFVLSIYREII